MGGAALSLRLFVLVAPGMHNNSVELMLPLFIFLFQFNLIVNKGEILWEQDGRMLPWSEIMETSRVVSRTEFI